MGCSESFTSLPSCDLAGSPMSLQSPAHVDPAAFVLSRSLSDP